ncbi:hypothetical protein FACS1894110_15720 [Spirochaetia bacterium]|nr:hypothetical protein FACS1894110_15720 [Spirochaetia bacterium]
MKKFILVGFFLFSMVFVTFAQNNSVTNNNSITINGNVYYFRPSTTPSSPVPNTPTTNFIGEGHWYGADAAKAWASISDWAIEHCLKSDRSVKPENGQIVYIHQVHAVPRSNKNGLLNINEWAGDGWALSTDIQLGVVKIYYWVVGRNAQMEDGERKTRTFYF